CSTVGADANADAEGGAADTGVRSSSSSSASTPLSGTFGAGGIRGVLGGPALPGSASAVVGAGGNACAVGSSCSALTCTRPANGAGGSAASQISAGESFRNVKLCDQPASLATVAFQIALPSGVGKAMPWSCSTLNTAVLLAGMPLMPCCSRCARSLSETVLLTSQSESWVSQPSEAWGWFNL